MKPGKTLYNLFQQLGDHFGRQPMWGYDTRERFHLAGIVFLSQSDQDCERERWVEDYVNRGQYDKAHELVVMLPRDRRVQVLQRLANEKPKRVLSVTNLLPEPERIKALKEFLKSWVREGVFDGALEAAKALGRDLTKKELTIIRAVQVAAGSFRPALNTVGLLGQELTVSELFTILDKWLEECVLRVDVVIECLPEEEQAKGWEKVLAFYLNKGWLVRSQEAVGHLDRCLTVSELETILAWHVTEGNFKTSCEVAGLIHRFLTQEELETILAKEVEDGNLEGARRTVGYLRRILTMKEMEAILATNMANHRHRGAYEVIVSLSEPRRTRELKKFRARLVREGLLKEMLRVSRALKQSTTLGELKRMFVRQMKEERFDEAHETANLILSLMAESQASTKSPQEAQV